MQTNRKKPCQTFIGVVMAAALLTTFGAPALASEPASVPNPAQPAPISTVVFKDNFEDAMQRTHRKVVMVDLYTPWCGWCKKLERLTYVDPKVEDTLGKNFFCVKLNAEDNGAGAAFAKKYGVGVYPTILFFDHGQFSDTPKAKILGYLPPDNFETAIEEIYSATQYKEYRHKDFIKAEIESASTANSTPTGAFSTAPQHIASTNTAGTTSSALNTAVGASAIDVGHGTFEFVDSKGNPERPLKVWYYRPQAWTKNSPILFVMHGVFRAADRYCREWSGLADKGNFLVVCPQFLEKDYPTEAYQWGNMFDSNKQPIPQEKWTFTAVEHLFDEVKSITGSTDSQYYIFGHSAGGQFVHRFVLFMPHARYKRAIAANPGWYTLPGYTGHAYPYGLRNSGLSEHDLKKSLSRDFVLMLGESDVDPNDPELNKGKLAEEQGPTRFERGQNFFKASQAEAQSLGADMHWQLRTVPHAHHSDSEMGVGAAPVLFE